MAEVIWSDRALTNIEEINHYVRMFNVSTSHRLLRRLIDSGNRLGSFPLRGRAVRRGERVLATVHPYLIIYRLLDDGSVFILRVRHAARRRR